MVIAQLCLCGDSAHAGDVIHETCQCVPLTVNLPVAFGKTSVKLNLAFWKIGPLGMLPVLPMDSSPPCLTDGAVGIKGDDLLFGPPWPFI